MQLLDIEAAPEKHKKYSDFQMPEEQRRRNFNKWQSKAWSYSQKLTYE